MNASATLPGTVKRIVKSTSRDFPDKAEIAVQGSESKYKEILIDNTLTNYGGEQVHLEAGAKVEVKVTEKADPIRFGRW